MRNHWLTGSIAPLLLIGIWLTGCLQDFNAFEPTGTGSGGDNAVSSSSTTSTTSTGMGGTPACVPANCDDMDPCTDDSCVDGTCQHQPKKDGTDAGNSDPNDCKKDVCKSGVATTVDDDDEIPDDANDCTTDSCSGGVAQHAPLDGTACGSGSTCIKGECGCNKPSDCGADPECATRTCTGNGKSKVCGLDFLTGDSTTQVQGDCQKRVCPGNDPAANVVGDSMDADDDGNECTADVCSGTKTTHDPVKAGTACMGSKECNALGTCCTPDGTACNGKQCGTALDNCGATISCTSTCNGAQLGCVANQCVECDAAGDCSASGKGHACLGTNVCGCASGSDCSGVSGKPACASNGAFAGTCQQCAQTPDCSASTAGHACLSATDTCGCGSSNDCTGIAGMNACASSGANAGTCQQCDGDPDCAASAAGTKCGAGAINTCGCSSSGDCTVDASKGVCGNGNMASQCVQCNGNGDCAPSHHCQSDHTCD